MSLWLEELRKGVMELCILNLLQHGESHSCEIFQSLRKIEQLAVTDSKVYPLLVELHKDGKVKIRSGTSGSGLPRQIFSLTALGRHRIQEMNTSWDHLKDDMDVFMNENREGAE